ncbi:glycoside hydrolase [Mycobacterium sp. MS1601]|uniref:coiled-coil domain-containing protein n=1 Tax=Mycobacterium sp. MS1601 TaxID=1936029 RepID=UPI0009797C06|nr:glycoside hydrolase [Mycobacterium sp. MS1601]AQA03188.1 glycoside hydrolase [Mycobacterium sp. MS1601]
MTWMRHSLRRTVCGSAAAVLVLAVSLGDVLADPAADALAKLNDLSSQALESRKAVTTAQDDVDAKLAVQTTAEERHRADLKALDVANAALAPYQQAVDQVAVMTYMSGHTGQLSAALTAQSPQGLIDGLSLQRAVATQAAGQLREFQARRERAAAAARASEKSAADARAAAQQAAAVRAELQAKLNEMLRQITAAEAQYAALTPQQQAAVDIASAPAPPPLAAMPGLPPGDVAPPGAPPLAPPPAAVLNPEALPVGVASEVGLQPNTILAARAVSHQFPQISDIGGVRPDSKPWHPSGLAIDIMIPNAGSPEGIALGDQIMTFFLSNAAQYGVQDVIWRGVYYTPGGPQGSGYGHFDHVHVTTTPRR